MKRVKLVLSGLAFLIIVSCSDSISVDEQKFYQATVLGKGVGCGETYLVRIKEGQVYLEQSSYFDPYIFYAYNLSEEFRIENLEILIKFRNPTTEEYYPCITVGVPYPSIIILEAKQK